MIPTGRMARVIARPRKNHGGIRVKESTIRRHACVVLYIYEYIMYIAVFFHAIQHPNMHTVSATVSFSILFPQLPSQNLFHLELPGFCRRLVQMGSTLLQQSQLD